MGRPLERKGFSESLRAFIRQNVASVEQVDVLLILQSAARRLAILCDRGLVKYDDEGHFQYVSDAAHDSLVGELRREYALRRTRVIELIYSKRTSALESFSDAFFLGGDDRDR
jgi:hypothetical protein